MRSPSCVPRCQRRNSSRRQRVSKCSGYPGDKPARDETRIADRSCCIWPSTMSNRISGWDSSPVFVADAGHTPVVNCWRPLAVVSGDRVDGPRSPLGLIMPANSSSPDRSPRYRGRSSRRVRPQTTGTCLRRDDPFVCRFAVLGLSVSGRGRVKTFFYSPKLYAAGRDPRRRDHLSIFLLYRVWSQSGRNLGPR